MAIPPGPAVPGARGRLGQGSVAARARPPRWQPANPAPQGVRLGTAVEIWLPARLRRGNAEASGGAVQEGVVVAVVPPGAAVPVAVANDRPLRGWRSLAPHYVVQCSNARVLCRASEMEVISL